MNCQTARATLELFRPDESDPAMAGEAEHHVRHCADCQQSVRAQREFDVRVGRMCRDVPVPAGLRDRLLTSLAADAAGSGEVAPQESAAAVAGLPVPGPVVRDAGLRGGPRRWLVRSLVAGSVAVVLAAGIGVGVLALRTRPTILLEDVVAEAIDADPAAMSEFQSFRGSVPLRYPATMDTRDLAGVVPRQLGRQNAAVYFFTFRPGGGRSHPGRLIVLPARAVKNPPTATRFLAEPIVYGPTYRMAAWVEGGLVYVCCVGDRGEDSLRGMQRSPA